MNLIDEMYLNTRFKIKSFFSDLKNDESGVSNIVATVILILVVVLLAAALWGFLSGFFGELFDKIVNAFNPDAGDVPNPYGGK